MGTSIPAAGTAHTKGTATQIWAGSSIITDVYQINLMFFTPSTVANRHLIDVLVDPAGGTSWSVLIANLAANTPNFGMTGASYHFPIFIKAGSSIGLQHACSTASVTIRAAVLVKGKPSRPEVFSVGSVVETIGATTASSEGTSFTPGNQVMGSYSASLGTTVRNCWFWQLGVLINNASQTSQMMAANVEAGDASNKLICMQGNQHIEPGTTETAGKLASPLSGLPYRRVPKGSNVYVRGWVSAATADTGYSAIVYAVA
jgi:hypothetical protein